MSKNKEVYVVTRDGRRIEEKNYDDKEEAKERMQTLVKVLRQWRDPDAKRVSIQKTDKPKKIK